MNAGEARGERLRDEYLHVERALAGRRIRHAILVLGSTRLRGESPYYEIAREFGRIAGPIVTGGGPGIMEAANRGALEAGAPSIGLNITLRNAQPENPYISPGLSFRFRYFALRKLHFLLRARALVAFPGGYGTFDELFETLTLVQTRKIRPMPIVLVGERYWRRAFDADFLVEQGMIDAADRTLYCYAETASGILEAIQGWYRRAGEPLFPAVLEQA